MSAEFSIHAELAKESEGKDGQNLHRRKVLPVAACCPFDFTYALEAIGWHLRRPAILIGHLDVAGAACGKIVAAVEIPPAAVLLLVHVYGCARSSVTDGKRHAG